MEHNYGLSDCRLVYLVIRNKGRIYFPLLLCISCRETCKGVIIIVLVSVPFSAREIVKYIIHVRVTGLQKYMENLQRSYCTSNVNLQRSYSTSNLTFGSVRSGSFKSLRNCKSLIAERYPDKSTIRVTIMGHTGCGKTSITKRLAGQDFCDTHIPTDTPIIHKFVSQIEKCSVEFEITDLTCEYVFSVMERTFLGLTDIVLVVYSVDNSESFQRCFHIYDRIKTSINCPVILVGNKTDLEIRKCPSYQTLQLYVETKLYVSYIEFSARNDSSDKLLRRIYEEFEISKGPYRVTMIPMENVCIEI